MDELYEHGELHFYFPTWFLADRDTVQIHEDERGAVIGEGTKLVGIKGQGGNKILALFDDEDLAERFVERDRLESAVLMMLENPEALGDLLERFSRDFTHAAYNPETSEIGNAVKWIIPIEVVLKRIREGS
jgi:hypothetical protein